ncbi:hypothetical protein AB0395_01445 [Streptosporangium sp. NPDC051023]|uniref:hypothetical protein n=1 Tax=Streptosporangium sp. NPDC051023 TaxID=3155410 RepID=UPI00344DBC74
MSVADERGALDHRLSLFDHASRLHELTPGLPLPDGGHPYPDEADHRDRPCDTTSRRKRGKRGKRRAAVPAVLKTFFTSPSPSFDALHDELRDLWLPSWQIALECLDELPPPALDQAREAGLWLARHSTDRVPALVGLCLLVGRARPADVPLVGILGLLDDLGLLAVEVIAAVPGSAPALIWLAERAAPHVRTGAIAAMCRLGDPVAVAWLLRRACADHDLAGRGAREVAEAVSLADVLEGRDADDEVLGNAGRLLRALCSTGDYSLEGLAYGDACRAVAAFAVQAEKAAPTLDLLASVLSLAEEVRSGHAALLPWPVGSHEATLDRLERLAASPRWAPILAEGLRSSDQRTRWRAGWAERATENIRSTPNRPGGKDPGRPGGGDLNHLALRVVVPDPALHWRVETRLLVDGRPVIAEAFRKGAPFGPERLLDGLEPLGEPREVRLAEAYCTEGCCGALYVTVTRDGESVTWSDWRDPDGTVVLEPFRFPADEYAEVLALARRDRRWEWPARSLARELDRLLRDASGPLAAWGCELDGMFTPADEQDRVRMFFWHPRTPSGMDDDEPWLQFEWVVPVDETTPESQAARVADQLRETDPKAHAKIVGGSRDFAERLGFPWPAADH